VTSPPAGTLPAGCLPRGLSRAAAACYCGISPSLFDRAVKDGLLPPPRRCYGRRVWDRHAIDLAMDAWPHAEGMGATPDVGNNPWGL
jgi:predicted DNA-binding transcriptional regulator AlpA